MDYEIHISPYAEDVLAKLTKEVLLAKTEWFKENPNATEKDWGEYFKSTIEWKEIVRYDVTKGD
jgi:mRNA-degrading endonuclease RelE of RelBE toxin-antitoxin system